MASAQAPARPDPAFTSELFEEIGRRFVSRNSGVRKVFPRVPISLFSVRCEMRSLDCECECFKKLYHPHALWHRHVARNMCLYLYFLVECYV